MLHACFYTIFLVFRYTSWRFYAFSRTNLLTRCHSASSLFSAIFVFQKSYTGNILGIGRNKSQTSRNSSKLPENQRGDRVGPRGAHTTGWHGPGLGHAPMCVATSVHFWRCPFAYKDPPPRREKPKHSITFLEYIAIRRRRRPEIGRVQKLFPAPCRRGKLPPEVFFIAMLACGAMSE
jgi:hypothetical protein